MLETSRPVVFRTVLRQFAVALVLCTAVAGGAALSEAGDVRQVAADPDSEWQRLTGAVAGTDDSEWQ
ncbi:hypothetical protein ACX6XY_06870 [Streptomyces sp. O3]